MLIAAPTEKKMPTLNRLFPVQKSIGNHLMHLTFNSYSTLRKKSKVIFLQFIDYTAVAVDHMRHL